MNAGGGWHRSPGCVKAWPECHEDGYDPRCCRFPKPCSCMERDSESEAQVSEEPAVRRLIRIGDTFGPLPPDVEPEVLYKRGEEDAWREALIPESKARKMAKDALRRGRREGRASSRRPPEAKVIWDRGASEVNEKSPPSRDVQPGSHPFTLNIVYGDGCTVAGVGSEASAFIASARCHPADRDSQDVGVNLALSRALFVATAWYFDQASRHADCHLRAPWAKKGD